MNDCLAATGISTTAIVIIGVLLALLSLLAIKFRSHTRYLFRAWIVIALSGTVLLSSAPTTIFAATTNPQDCNTSSGGSATATTSPPSNGSVLSALSLPRIPWEGGNSYYTQFSSAANRGWSSPNFFPIALWWGVFENDAEVQWDKAHGINTYVVSNPADPDSYELIERNGMSWIGGQLPGSVRSSPAWVGDFLDDEVDGRFNNTDGPAFLQSLIDALPDHNKIRYTNYTSSIVNIWFDDTTANKYVNDYTDTVSMDMYFYTVPFCSWDPYSTDYYIVQIPEATCRTSASYGKLVDMLRQRDTADGSLQPLWNFIENVSGSPAEQDPSTIITTSQLKGAAMSSIIHEARGLIWFNNVFAGPCGSGNAIRSAQIDPSYPCAAQIEAMGEINNQVQSLAPVLNTQSYQWNFGANLETMLKTYNGSAYIFAMPNGANGNRTFSLPPELAAKTVAEVVGESRSVTISDGTFTDNFANESSYHIYKITL